MRARVRRDWRKLSVVIVRHWRRMISATRLAAENVRANVAVRERALASAVFAGIFAFGALGIDYLITGGPDWNPGGAEAYAMEIPQSAAVAPRQSQITQETAPPVHRSAFSEIDYSVAGEELLGGPDAYALYDATGRKGEDEEAGQVIVWSYPEDVGVKPVAF